MSMPPPNMPPPPPWPPYPPQQPPPGGGSGMVVGMALVGALLFIVCNAMFGFLVLALAQDTPNPAAVIGIAAALSALVAFVGGIVLIRRGSAVPKGIGIGLMIGWAAVTILTAGFCTGVNPSLYSDWI